jgi:hypothetical protein
MSGSTVSRTLIRTGTGSFEDGDFFKKETFKTKRDYGINP